MTVMKPLEGIRVLDLTHMLSGPYGTMLLADLGAETIKVEPPQAGEGTRKLLAKNPDYSMHGMGAYFLTLNRNKRSVCIDLKSDEGRDLFYGLVRQSDVVFDNFSAGVTKRLRVDYDTLSEINTRIITCSVTGFGSEGPDPNRPAFDQVVQAMGGGMSITGENGGRPLRAGIPIGDLGGGMFAAIGIQSALLARERTGVGQHVDISMLDCQISMLNYMATMYSLSGKNPGPIGNGHFVHVPYNSFDTATRPIIIAVIFDSFWEKLVEIVDVPEFRDRKYLTQPGRFEDRDFINRRLQEVLLTRTAEDWIVELNKAQIPVAPVNNFEQALNDPQVRYRNMVVTVDHPRGGSTEMPGNPVKLSRTTAETYSPPPELGQDTDEVLGDLLGLNSSELERLRQQSIIR
ncbi:MAG: CoA transferase [Ectothiorhodospiraceae bacterium]|nr:CoA transferase [Ectothiorhodospiraceae bacterium]